MVYYRKQEAIVNLPPTGPFIGPGSFFERAYGRRQDAVGLRAFAGPGSASERYAQDPTCRPILIVITDGKANESIGKGDPFWEALSAAKGLAADTRVKSIVVDPKSRVVSNSGCRPGCGGVAGRVFQNQRPESR